MVIEMELTEIKAEEKEQEKLSLIRRFQNRFKYNIKKMDIMAGKYNLDKPVILHQNALMKAVIYSGITLKTQGYKEIMGWLAGKRANGTIEIVDAYIGDCKSSSGYTEMNPLETIKLKKMAKERGLELVGQFHLHPAFSTTPSGIDDDFMRNIEKFGIKTPVQLIVNMTDFNLSIMEKGKRKKADFIIPPKTDNGLHINLGYINGEYNDFATTILSGDFNNYFGENQVVVFCGYIGNQVLIGLNYLTFKKFNLGRWIEKEVVVYDKSN